jgi:adenosylcobinamide-GDP ribazoletransferase
MCPAKGAGLPEAMRLIDDARICLIFFTRLPVKWQEDLPRERITRAFRAAPVAGMVAGLIGAAVYFAVGAVTGNSPYISAAFAVCAQLMATGAFHEDGLADFFDGAGGGSTPEARLEIMRDSRIGTYGAAALGMALLLKVLLIAELALPWQVAFALIATGALSRTALVQVMTLIGPASSDGLSAEAGQPTRTEGTTAVMIGVGIAALALLLAAGPMGVLGLVGAVAGAAVGAVGVALMARKLLGGQTGDALGATAVVAEIGALLGLVVLLPVGM